MINPYASRGLREPRSISTLAEGILRLHRGWPRVGHAIVGRVHVLGGIGVFKLSRYDSDSSWPGGIILPTCHDSTRKDQGPDWDFREALGPVRILLLQLPWH